MFNYPLILASGSPRRLALLKGAGFNVRVIIANVDESLDMAETDFGKAAMMLAKRKARKVISRVADSATLLLAADTLVVLDGKVLGKPVDLNEAKKTLQILSGKRHEVITGVYLSYGLHERLFNVSTSVYFSKLTDEMINYYVETFKPLDKAGAYAIQEWIGMVGIEKINGDYFNVVGLPMQAVVQSIKELLLLD